MGRYGTSIVRTGNEILPKWETLQREMDNDFANVSARPAVQKSICEGCRIPLDDWCCWGKLCVGEPEEASMSRFGVEQSSQASWHALKIWF